MQEISALLALARVDSAINLSDGYQCINAHQLARQYYPQVALSLPLLITGIDSAILAQQLKILLRKAYPDDHAVTRIDYLIDNPKITTSSLHEFDDQASFALPITLYLPPLPLADFSALQAIVAHLRAPEGCPWDRAQTLQSMRHDLLSECTEVLEAIDAEANGTDNSDHIAEELGDLCMVAVLLVQIAGEAKRFQMADVVHAIVTKLIRRHPHVFGDTIIDGVGSLLANWDAIKAQEKAAKGQAPAHPLEGIPAHLPALEKARQLQAKAAKAGLLDRAALVQNAPALVEWLGASPTEARLGDLLWHLSAIAHEVGLNAEDALRSYVVNYRAVDSKQ